MSLTGPTNDIWCGLSLTVAVWVATGKRVLAYFYFSQAPSPLHQAGHLPTGAVRSTTPGRGAWSTEAVAHSDCYWLPAMVPDRGPEHP